MGPFGLLQPIADGIKLFIKEDITPAQADKVVFIIAPVITDGAGADRYAVIPFGRHHGALRPTVTLSITDINVGLLLFVSGHVDRACTRSSSAAGRRTTSTRCSAGCARRRR